MALDPEYLGAIKGFEGYSPNAAWDYKQSSSGYGTKAQPGDEGIPPDQLKAVHEQRFQDEVAKAAAHVDAVNPNLPPGARAALVSLTYNAGPGWSQSGLGEMVRSGDLQGAASRFLEYNKAGGEVNPGLVARRQKEAAWFGGGQPQGQPAPAPLNPQTARVASAIMGTPQTQAPMPQTAGDVASQLMGVPQQPIQGGGGFGQAPAEQPMQPMPIQFAQRRAPDLSKLKAAFQLPQFYGKA